MRETERERERERVRQGKAERHGDRERERYIYIYMPLDPSGAGVLALRACWFCYPKTSHFLVLIPNPPKPPTQKKKKNYVKPSFPLPTPPPPPPFFFLVLSVFALHASMRRYARQQRWWRKPWLYPAHPVRHPSLPLRLEGLSGCPLHTKETQPAVEIKRGVLGDLQALREGWGVSQDGLGAALVQAGRSY